MAATHLADVPTADTTPPADAAGPGTRTPLLFDIGDRVEVRRRLDDKWARGFEVLETSDAGYRLRRMSDGVEIPATFPTADIRKERKRDYWWY